MGAWPKGRREKRRLLTKRVKEAIKEEKKGSKGKKKNMSKNTTRQFLLVTLIHVETEKRRRVEKVVIEQRITNLFQCRSVIIARENHEENGFHYHIGIWNENASKNTVIKKIREKFCEWDGRCIDVRAHKGWGSVCKYVLKEDKEPRV